MRLRRGGGPTAVMSGHPEVRSGVGTVEEGGVVDVRGSNILDRSHAAVGMTAKAGDAGAVELGSMWILAASIFPTCSKAPGQAAGAGGPAAAADFATSLAACLAGAAEQLRRRKGRSRAATWNIR